MGSSSSSSLSCLPNKKNNDNLEFKQNTYFSNYLEKLKRIEVLQKNLENHQPSSIENKTELENISHWVMRITLSNGVRIIVEKNDKVYGFYNKNKEDDINEKERDFELNPMAHVSVKEKITLGAFLNSCKEYSDYHKYEDNSQHFILKILDDARKRWTSLSNFYDEVSRHKFTKQMIKLAMEEEQQI